MSESGLRFTLDLPAPAERVFAALTGARELERWFCDACESEPRANGRLVLRWKRPGSGAPGGAGSEPFEARWVEFVPPSRAAFHGGSANYPSADAGTVWFSIVRGGAGTRLEVRHEWPRRDEIGRAHV